MIDMKKGTTNPHLKKLIIDLKKTKSRAWKSVASKLEGSNRRRSEVSVRKINRYSKVDDTVIVPGKVLSDGGLDHKVTVAALSFSAKARDKINLKGEIVSIRSVLEKNPKGSKIKILV